MTTAVPFEHPVSEGEDFSPRLTSPVLVGREKELGALLTIARTPPAVALIEGEAGVGKTRIVEELLTLLEHPARRTLFAKCQEIREPFPLGPLVEALRGADFADGMPLGPATGALRRLLPELADRLPPEPDRPHDPRSQRHLLYRGVRESGPCADTEGGPPSAGAPGAVAEDDELKFHRPL